MMFQSALILSPLCSVTVVTSSVQSSWMFNHFLLCGRYLRNQRRWAPSPPNFWDPCTRKSNLHG